MFWCFFMFLYSLLGFLLLTPSSPQDTHTRDTLWMYLKKKRMEKENGGGKSFENRVSRRLLGQSAVENPRERVMLYCE
uniref:Putative secreted protein n=1 Tax=Anopheles marajoara TaxID=58244 RepID=A0A2M4CCM2_9DIPT